MPNADGARHVAGVAPVEERTGGTSRGDEPSRLPGWVQLEPEQERSRLTQGDAKLLPVVGVAPALNLQVHGGRGGPPFQVRPVAPAEGQFAPVGVIPCRG